MGRIFPLVDLQYNCSEHAAAKMKLCRSMFRTVPFEFNCSMTLEYHLVQHDKPQASTTRAGKYAGSCSRKLRRARVDTSATTIR